MCMYMYAYIYIYKHMSEIPTFLVSLGATYIGGFRSGSYDDQLFLFSHPLY